MFYNIVKKILVCSNIWHLFNSNNNKIKHKNNKIFGVKIIKILGFCILEYTVYFHNFTLAWVHKNVLRRKFLIIIKNRTSHFVRFYYIIQIKCCLLHRIIKKNRANV